MYVHFEKGGTLRLEISSLDWSKVRSCQEQIAEGGQESLLKLELLVVPSEQIEILCGNGEGTKLPSLHFGHFLEDRNNQSLSNVW
jgi:hypothetical protein